MKKLLLLSALLLGAASVSQAGVHFSFGLPLPPLPLPGIAVSPPVVAAAPAYCPPNYYNGYGYGYGPSVVVTPPAYYGYGYYGRPYYYGHYGHGYYHRGYPAHGYNHHR